MFRLGSPKRRSADQMEKGWDNHCTVGRKMTQSKKYGYGFSALLKPIDLTAELQTLSGLNESVENEKAQFFSNPRPVPAYFSIAAALGLKHHEGTDVTLELEVVKRIIARESSLVTLETLGKRLVKMEALQRTTTALENEMLQLLATMREQTVRYLEALATWREQVPDYDPTNPRVFYWMDNNYTLKITRDLDFLAEQPLLINSLQIPLDKIRMNPLMLPNTLEESENWVEPTQRAAMDAGVDSGPVYQKRLRVRLAERILLAELETAFATEAMAANAAAAVAGPRSMSPPQLPPQQHLVEHLDEFHGLGLGLSQRGQRDGGSGGSGGVGGGGSAWGKSAKSLRVSGKGGFSMSGKGDDIFPPTYDLSAPSSPSAVAAVAPAGALAEYSEEERRDMAFLNWHLAAQLQLHKLQGNLGEDLVSRSTNRLDPLQPESSPTEPHFAHAPTGWHSAPTPLHEFHSGKAAAEVGAAVALSRPSSSYTRPEASAGGSRHPNAAAASAGPPGQGHLDASPTPDGPATAATATTTGAREYSTYGQGSGGDDDDDGYGGDAFETGDEALDPFRRDTAADAGAAGAARPPPRGHRASGEGTASSVDGSRPRIEIHTAGVDFIDFDAAESTSLTSSSAGGLGGVSGPVTFSAYNMHELLDPVEPYELDRLGALDSPPPRLLLATAGVVILLSRRDGVDSVPRDVGYTAFQRLAKVLRHTADAMNAIDPGAVSRVKMAALEGFMHILNVHDDFPGSGLTATEIEMANKLCKWVVLVVSAARAAIEARKHAQKQAQKLAQKSALQRATVGTPGGKKRPAAGSGGGSGGGAGGRKVPGGSSLLSKSQSLASASRVEGGGPASARPVKPPGHQQLPRISRADMFKKEVRAGSALATTARAGSPGGPGGPGHRRGHKPSTAVGAARARGAAAAAAAAGAGRPATHQGARPRPGRPGQGQGSDSHLLAAMQKEMWPVHSELIEMGLHVHPVLLTLASTLRDGVVSLEDGLLAKAYDLVNSQEAVTTIDIREYNAHLHQLQQAHPPEAVYSAYQPLNVDWWAHVLRHIVVVETRPGQPRMTLQVSKEKLEAVVVERVYGQQQQQQQQGYDGGVRRPFPSGAPSGDADEGGYDDDGYYDDEADDPQQHQQHQTQQRRHQQRQEEDEDLGIAYDGDFETTDDSEEGRMLAEPSRAEYRDRDPNAPPRHQAAHAAAAAGKRTDEGGGAGGESDAGTYDTYDDFEPVAEGDAGTGRGAARAGAGAGAGTGAGAAAAAAAGGDDYGDEDDFEDFETDNNNNHHPQTNNSKPQAAPQQQPPQPQAPPVGAGAGPGVDLEQSYADEETYDADGIPAGATGGAGGAGAAAGAVNEDSAELSASSVASGLVGAIVNSAVARESTKQGTVDYVMKAATASVRAKSARGMPGAGGAAPAAGPGVGTEGSGSAVLGDEDSAELSASSVASGLVGAIVSTAVAKESAKQGAVGHILQAGMTAAVAKSTKS